MSKGWHFVGHAPAGNYVTVWDYPALLNA